MQIKKAIKNLIKKLIFGTPISGTPAFTETKFKTTIPDSYGISFNEWAKINNISTRVERQ